VNANLLGCALLAFPSSSMIFISFKDDKKIRFAYLFIILEACKNHEHCFQLVCAKRIIINSHSLATLLIEPDA